MFKTQRGFTPLELIFALAILGTVAVGIVPDLFGARNSAREAEVKSNIHAIQIALERYAVDSGGIYPTFLVGGERAGNILTSYRDHKGNGISVFPKDGITPFARTAEENLAVADDGQRFLMDPLIQFGYMADYPVNPFARRDTGMFNSLDVHGLGLPGIYPYGGEHGDIMFDLGFGWGDTPQTDFMLYPDESIREQAAADSGGEIVCDPDMDAPGNFYYHPIFQDLVPVYFHYAAKYRVVEGEDFDASSLGITSHYAYGYYLYGYSRGGSSDSSILGGLDFFDRMPDRNNLPEAAHFLEEFIPGKVLDSSAMVDYQVRVETTGYPRHEYDPWTGLFADGINPQDPGENSDQKSGPDGYLDWVIIEVTSGVAYHN